MKIKIISLLMMLVLLFSSCGTRWQNTNENSSGTNDSVESIFKNDDNTESTTYTPMNFSSVPENPASDFEYREVNNFIKITKYIGNSKIVKIPGTIDGVTVRNIADSAFKENTEITHVYIPDNIYFLGEYCFDGCSKLQEVRLSSKLGGIPTHCFADCTSLVKINISDSISSLGAQAFYNCKSLTEFIASESFCSLNMESFAESGLIYVDLSKATNIISMGYYSFSNCTNLKSVIFPPAMECDEDEFGYVFQGCVNLCDFSIGKNSTSMNILDEDCYLSVENGVLYRDDCILADAPANLQKNIVIRDGTTYINMGAFEYSQLESIKIPETMEYIAKCAFRYCENLTKVEIVGTLEKGMGQSNFAACPSLKEFTYNGKTYTVDEFDTLEQVING